MTSPRHDGTMALLAMLAVLVMSMARVSAEPAETLITVIARGPSFKGSSLLLAPWGQLNGPRGMAFRPGTRELYVVNYRTDSLTIISSPGKAQTIANIQDCYSEHFFSVPSAISFNGNGLTFSVSAESHNEVRNMTFYMNPERNEFFRDNGFMGPTLFKTEEFAKMHQYKTYLGDWPQHGQTSRMGGRRRLQAMDHGNFTCNPASYPANVNCSVLPQGSHIDMLHYASYSSGIVWRSANSYFALDGCGHTDEDSNWSCLGDGHVVFHDFNQDHGAGHGFHGDAIVTRYLDAQYTRVPGVMSGMVIHDGWMYWSNTGNGTVHRLRQGTGEKLVWVGNWNPAFTNGTTPVQLTGYGGVQFWEDVPKVDQPPLSHDGEDPAVIAWWIQAHGNQTAMNRTVALGKLNGFNGSFITPRELTYELSVNLGSTREVVASTGLSHPSGLVIVSNILYVADAFDGLIRGYNISSGFSQVGSALRTGAGSLQGLAASPLYPDTLFFSDALDNYVGSVSLK